jgi:hypothetical protein
MGLKWKISEKKEGKRRMMLEGVNEGSVVLLELSDGVMKQVEAMAKELRRISRGIQALVEGVGRLTEVDIGFGKKEAEKRDKETEMEIVRRVDREIETEIVVEDSESEEEEEEKGDDRKVDEADEAEKKNGDQETEEVGQE